MIGHIRSFFVNLQYQLLAYRDWSKDIYQRYMTEYNNNKTLNAP